MKAILILLVLAASANAEIVLDLNYSSTPSNSLGPYTATSDRAGFLVRSSNTITFTSISSKFAPPEFVGTKDVVLEIFAGTPDPNKGTSNLPSLGSTSATVSSGAVTFDFSSAIQFTAKQDYLVGFKGLNGIGGNYKFSPATTPVYFSAEGADGEFRQFARNVSPILRFEFTPVPEPDCIPFVGFLIVAIPFRHRKRIRRQRSD